MLISQASMISGVGGRSFGQPGAAPRAAQSQGPSVNKTMAVTDILMVLLAIPILLLRNVPTLLTVVAICNAGSVAGQPISTGNVPVMGPEVPWVTMMF